MRFITLHDERKVISIRCGAQAVEGEVKSDTGEIGQIMQSDGSFISPVYEVEVQPTLEDK